jgi:hypothetical protein
MAISLVTLYHPLSTYPSLPLAIATLNGQDYDGRLIAVREDREPVRQGSAPARTQAPRTQAPRRQ